MHSSLLKNWQSLAEKAALASNLGLIKRDGKVIAEAKSNYSSSI